MWLYMFKSQFINVTNKEEMVIKGVIIKGSTILGKKKLYRYLRVIFATY